MERISKAVPESRPLAGRGGGEERAQREEGEGGVSGARIARSAEESCGGCHYDYEPVENSQALVAEGLPDLAKAGGRYDFVLRFAEAEASTSGFQIAAAGDGSDAGRFTSDEADLESLANAIRSTATRPVDGEVRWAMTWHAPSGIAGKRSRVTFYLAASAANDDQSPFGDVIHYRKIEVDVAPKGESDL